MSHIDPDDLAMLALGELMLDADDAAHLAACGICADELRAIEQTVSSVRNSSGAGLVAPSPRVWDAVAREIAGGSVDEPEEKQNLRPLHSPERRARRARRWGVLAGGLVAAAAVTVVVVTLVTPRPVDVATATLDPFPDHPDARGSATLERQPNGAERVIVDLDADLASDGYREVWLLTADGSALVSLGTLDGTTGSFAVPDDVDVSRFRVVDISQEPDDGDAAHSGDSIVRGELTST